MPDKSNPFGDVEKEVAQAIERQLALVRSLDGMDNDVTSWEAGFLESVLVRLEKEQRPLSQEQIDVIHQMCERYEIDFDL